MSLFKYHESGGTNWLDNLKLGFGGTKTEMERLLKDAQDLKRANGEMVTYSIDSFADMVEAIHVVQDNMGITGTTAKEASTTIQGSMNALKSAWENVLTGLGDDTQDFGELMDNFVEAIGTAGDNLIPRIEIIFKQIPKLIQELTPQIVQLVKDLLPPLIEASVTLIAGLAQELPSLIGIIVTAIWDMLPTLVSAVGEILESLGNSAWDVLTTVIDNLFGESGTTILDSVGGILGNVKNAISDAMSDVKDAIDWLKEHNEVIQDAIDMLGILASAYAGFKVGKTIQDIAKKWQNAQLQLALYGGTQEGVTIAQGIQNGVFSAWEVIVGLLTGKITLAEVATGLWAKTQAVLNGFMSANPIALVIAGIVALIAVIVLCVKHWDTIKETMQKVWDSMVKVWGNVSTWFTEKVLNPIKEIFDKIKEKITEVFQNAWDSLTQIWSDVTVWFNDNVVKPVSDAFETIKNAIEVAIMFIGNLFSLALDVIMIPWNFIWENFSEPITNAWNEVTEYISNALNEISEHISEAWDSITTKTSEIWNGISEYISGIWESIYTTVSEWINSVSEYIGNIWNWIVTKTSEIWNTVVNYISTAWNNIYTSVTTWLSNVWEKITSTFTKIRDEITNKFNEAKENLSNTIEKIKTSISDGFTKAWNTVKDIFEKIKESIRQPIEKARDLVHDAIEKMKSYFKFTWSLPKLKLPHINISGSFSLLPPSAPKFSIDWYKNGGILTDPTIFGFNPMTGNYMAGGEAGAEAIAPISDLQDYVRVAVRESNTETNERLNSILSILSDFLPNIGNYNVVLDSGVLVGEIAPQMDEELGTIKRRKGR